jgi:TRAP-type uncharacterized transport system substrate-binding protein
MEVVMGHDQSSAPENDPQRSRNESSDDRETASPKRDVKTRSSRFLRLRVRRWVTIPGIVIPALLALLFLTLWLVRRERIPRALRLATARADSSYDVFGGEFCSVLSVQLPRQTTRVLRTDGSRENIQKLRSHFAELGMYQGGTYDLNDIAVVAPLYHEVVHVLVKKRTVGQPQDEAHELSGELLRGLLVVDEGEADAIEVYAGGIDSGMRRSAKEILEHYGIDTNKVRFTERETPSTDIVISTTGMFSEALQLRLKGSEYQYLSVDADAIAGRHTHFVPHTIHRASFRDETGQAVPNREVKTVATTAFLIVRRDASPKLVRAALDALYQGDLGREFPDLIPKDKAKPYLHGMPVHEAALQYFYPLDYGYLKDAVESLAATKELLVALGAGLYVLWTLRRRRLKRQRQAEIKANRVRLDWFVDRTIAIESAQMGVTDPQRLTEYLEEVTRIKLEALDELTDAELRGDQAFAIFLTQCANLISRLQLKIISLETSTRGQTE